MITSFITAKGLAGIAQDPAGYVPFVAPADEYFVTTHTLAREYDELTLFAFDPSTSTNIASFLAAVKLDLDTNYAATSFTDPARNYTLDYKVVKVERTYNAPTTSIWEEREYVWKVTINTRVNTNA